MQDDAHLIITYTLLDIIFFNRMQVKSHKHLACIYCITIVMDVPPISVQASVLGMTTWQRSICRIIVVYTGIQFDLTRVGSPLDTRATLLTLTRVATRLESSRTIYHIDYIVQCTNQNNVRHLAFTVKSVSFKSFDLQTPQGMRNCSTRVTAGAHYFHPERCPGSVQRDQLVK